MTSQDSSPIDVAVVGVGRMGRHHARLYHDLPGARLVAVVDADTERAETVAEDYGCAAVSNVEALVQEHPQVRAVSIAVPTVDHEPVARALLGRGIACLIEKPLAGSSDAARRIVDAAAEHNVLLQIGHTERFNPAVRAVADMDITPRFIEIDRVSPMTFRSIDVGVVFDIMIHDLDIVLMMARSPLKEIRAAGVAVLGEHEDVANARLEFADGCVANLTASRLALKTERKLRVFSETAYVSLDFARKTGVVISRTANTEQLERVRARIADGADLADVDYMDLVNVQDLSISDEEPLRAELTNFLDAVAGRAAPAVDAQAGLAAVRAAEQVTTAIAHHTWQGVDSGRIV